MKRAAIKLILTFCVYFLLFQLLRIAFMMAQGGLYLSYGIIGWFEAMWHGVSMDCSVAGYLTAVPALLYVVEAAMGTRPWIRVCESAWFVLSAIAVSMVYVSDAILYGYWGFRLDTMPLFYLSTSPSAAFASARWWEIVIGGAGILLVSTAIWFAFAKSVLKIEIKSGGSVLRRVVRAFALLLFSGLLVIPIRGGVGLAPMNLSRAYFSSDSRLNHAAVNPAFSLLYSATHIDDSAEEFRFFDGDEATNAIHNYFDEFAFACEQPLATDTVPPVQSLCADGVDRPDIWLIILESFSSHLLPSAGGEPVALGLDSIANSSLWFTNFYANSFRTDRALTSILNGFPALPTLSVLTRVDKAEHLPSLAQELKQRGYTTNYFYGGDINFANMKALLVSGGYDNVYSESSFPAELRTGKWGVADGTLFDFALGNPAGAPDGGAYFNVVQTSSSHEPFDVPYCNPRFAHDPIKNAFAYTDSCLTEFVNRLRMSPRWKNTLVAIVPDHLGAWPLNLPEATERHHVPFVITGGALNSALAGVRDSAPASQMDIAPTLLHTGQAMTGVFMGRDLMNRNLPPFAIFSEPEMAALVTPTDTVCYIIPQQQMAGSKSEGARGALKALLQMQYTRFSEL